MRISGNSRMDLWFITRHKSLSGRQIPRFGHDTSLGHLTSETCWTALDTSRNTQFGRRYQTTYSAQYSQLFSGTITSLITQFSNTSTCTEWNYLKPLQLYQITRSDNSGMSVCIITFAQPETRNNHYRTFLIKPVHTIPSWSRWMMFYFRKPANYDCNNTEPWIYPKSPISIRSRLDNFLTHSNWKQRQQ